MSVSLRLVPILLMVLLPLRFALVFALSLPGLALSLHSCGALSRRVYDSYAREQAAAG
jgi:hypothetical protein